MRRLDIAIGPSSLSIFRLVTDHTITLLSGTRNHRWTLLCIFPFLLGHPFSFGFLHRSTVAFMLKFIGETREIPLFVSSSISLYIFYLCSPLPSCLSLVTVLVLHHHQSPHLYSYHPHVVCSTIHSALSLVFITTHPTVHYLRLAILWSFSIKPPFLTLLWVHSRSLRLGYNTMLLISCRKFSGVTGLQYQAPVPQT